MSGGESDFQRVVREGVEQPGLTLAQAQNVVATKTAPRVTIESIIKQIARIGYLFDGTLTIAVIEMRNGFKVVGKAAPADERNFDPEVGKRYAYEDGLKQLWALEGYLLCEVLRPRAPQLDATLFGTSD